MRRKILSSAAATVVVAMGLTSHSQAAAIYLDVNNTVAGSGVVSAANVPWDTSTSSWNTDSAGVGTGTTTYVNDGSSDASFAAGTDGAVAYTMTVNGAISANSLTFDEGKVTFAGTATPSLSIGGGGVNVNVTTSTASASAPVFGATLPVTIAADQVWSTSSPGTTTVNGVVTFNGKLTLRRTPTLVNASNFAFANGASTGAGGVVIGQGAANPATLQIAANEVVTAGVLVSGPMGTGTVSLNGGRISSNAAANARTISNAVTLDATGSAIGGQSNVGALTFASTFTVNATADGGTVTFDAGASAAQALNFNGGT
ncbi:MAG: Autotransporter-associated beta strand repeat protein, partial [Phycisphaerales bacterium]|nr:Autotransporter-associated beta strand repeat protein [Phycisphaerales bacterium]